MDGRQRYANNGCAFRWRHLVVNEYQQQIKSLSFHKMQVIKVGLVVGGVPLRQLLMHDMSKLSPVEFINYSRFKYGIKSIDGWAKAWLHHLHHNKHHPEHWVLSWRGDPDYYRGMGKYLAPFVVILAMPRIYVREYIIDIMATGKEKARSYDITSWLNENGPAVNFHDDTLVDLDSEMFRLGYFSVDACPWTYMAGADAHEMFRRLDR